LDFDISEHRDHHLKTELHKISFKNFSDRLRIGCGTKVSEPFLREFSILRRSFGCDRIFGPATVQLRFWFWHDLEIEAELRAWYYHKPQSPFLVIFPGRLKPGIRTHGECSPIARSKPEHAWFSMT
jgi:hypothetical protein